MHRHSAFHALPQRNLDDQCASNIFLNFAPNYRKQTSPRLDAMSPRETLPTPESRMSNADSSNRPVPTELPRRLARVVEPGPMTGPASSMATMATGTRNQEAHLQLPGPDCICEIKIATLENELIEARHQIATMSIGMEEQASHLQQLLEERYDLQTTFRPEISFPLFTPGGCNPGYSRYPESQNSRHSFTGYSQNPRCSSRSANSFCGLAQRPQPLTSVEKSHLVQGLNPQFVSQLGHNPDLVESLNDKVMALQMTNLTLNLYLQKEEARRKNAESDLLKERTYIKQLEDNIQNLKSSRIVMDPKTYKQVADNYIATRKRPVRRSHTCHPCIGQSDLVCDNDVTLHSKRYTPIVTSCPSSPLNAKTASSKEVNAVNAKHTFWPEGKPRPMQREEYETLLNSLADMEIPCSSSP